MSHPDHARFHGLLGTFKRDKGGAVALMFAGGAFALALIAGGAVEIHRRNLAMQQLQNAADSAALAGKQRQVFLQQSKGLAASQALGRAAADEMFKETLKTSKYFTSLPTGNYTWNPDGSLTVQSAPNYDVIFNMLLPTSFAKIDARATANFANALPTEIAMVLDNTMSMFAKDSRPETRFTLMRNAAKKFTHQVFNAAQTTGDPNLVRISVVPWGTTVNVLGAAPAAADFTGDGPVTSIPDYGSRLAVLSPMSRPMVTNTGSAHFAPVPWRGCISGATENPTSYTDGGVATFDSLRTQSAPIYNITVREGPVTAQSVTTCSCSATQDVPCSPPGPGTGTQGFHRLIEKTVPQVRNARLMLNKDIGEQGSPKADKAQCTTCISQSCSTISVNLPDCSSPTATRTVPYCYYYSNNGRRNSFNPTSFACTEAWDGCYESGKGPIADKTSPACVADPNEPGIYNNSMTWCPQFYAPDAKVWDSVKPVSGPNVNCVAPMLGLSGNRKQVLEYMDRMSPVPGGTHSDIGLRWGLRTLAKDNNWPSFFGLTKPPAAWGTSAQKVMVMITDGENEQALDFRGYWGCGQIDGDHPDCTGSPDAATLDTRMQGWCDAIRTTYQVEIFAVAVNFTNTAAVQRLKNCTGKDGNVFNVDAADLTTVLSGIAARVMALRLTQ